MIEVCLMSQSWDNVASMHDHRYLLTVHAEHRDVYVVYAQTIDLPGK